MSHPTTAPNPPLIVFTRLTAVPLDEVVSLLNETRNTRHMPLARRFTPDETSAWVQAKNDQWVQHGYGPWAILIDGDFAGWGGFQHEPNGPDYALVLTPHYWGAGAAVTRQAFRVGFNDFGFETILIALPPSRNPDRVVARLGFRPDTAVEYDGAAFRQYRLSRHDAARLDPAIRRNTDPITRV